MRNTVQELMVLSMAIVLSFSCNLVMPERVQITGSPTVDVSVGAVAVDITKYVDLEQMLTDSLSGAFSDPGDSFDNETIGDVYVIKARKQLFTQPLGDIFDMDTGLGGLTQTIEPMSFSVPTFTNVGNYSQTLEGDSLGTLSMPSVPPLPLFEGNVPDTTVTIPLTGSIAVTAFSSLTLTGGNMAVAMTSGASPGLDLTVSAAWLLDGSDNVLATADISTPVLVKPTGAINFDLAGVTIPDQIKFRLEIGMANAQVFSAFDLGLVASLESPEIQSATGVDFSDTVSGSESITLDKPADLVSATIGTGELVITLAPPAGFSGVTTGFSATLTFEGSQVRPAVLDTGTTYKINLNGIVLSTFAPASLVYDLEVTGTDATVAFPADFGITTSLSITSFSEVVLTAADLDFSYTEPFIIDPSILDAVQSATFSDARLVFNLVNGLPSDLIIDFSSQVLAGGALPSLLFEGGSSVADTQFLTLLSHSGNSLDFATDLVDAGPDKAIDIDLGISLSGYDAGELTLTDVVPGEEYLFSGNFELILDLASVTLGDVSQTGNFPEDGGDPLDFSALGDFLPPGVNLNDNPVEGIRSWLVVSSGMDLAIDVVVLGKYLDADSITKYINLLDPELGEVLESDFLDPLTYATSEAQPLIAGRLELFLAKLVNLKVSELELAYYLSFEETTVILGSAEDQGSLDILM